MRAVLGTYLPSDLGVADYAEIGLLFLLVYGILRMLRGSVAGALFRWPGLLFWPLAVALFVAMRLLSLEVLDYVLARAVALLFIALVVLFQPELRHGIARFAELRMLRNLARRGGDPSGARRTAEQVVAAVRRLAAESRGALIAIERQVDLSSYADRGVRLDAIVRAETLQSVFCTEAALHDGAVILRGDRILAAACVLPLTERTDLGRGGTRHRAALGLTEESDAAVIVVSEETGRIQVAESGALRPVQPDDLFDLWREREPEPEPPPSGPPPTPTSDLAAPPSAAPAHVTPAATPPAPPPAPPPAAPAATPPGPSVAAADVDPRRRERDPAGAAPGPKAPTSNKEAP